MTATFLNLLTAFSTDRKQVVYPGSVPPDRLITGPDNFDNPAADYKVKAALEWLKKKKNY